MNWSAQTTIEYVHIMSANVRYWHLADIATAPTNVRFRGKSGHLDLRDELDVAAARRTMPAGALPRVDGRADAKHSSR